MLLPGVGEAVGAGAGFDDCAVEREPVHYGRAEERRFRPIRNDSSRDLGNRLQPSATARRSSGFQSCLAMAPDPDLEEIRSDVVGLVVVGAEPFAPENAN